MRWDRLPRSDNIDDRRGMGGGLGGGGRFPGGRGGLGIGTVIALGLLGWALGIDPRILIGGAELLSGGGPAQQYEQQQGRSGAPNDEMGKFVSAVLGSADAQWKVMFEEAGRTYRPPRLVMFTGRTSANACGLAQSAMGPFYCPPAREIYLDTSFFTELERRFGGCSGEACRFAQAYVIAHEVGHHIQNETGILDRARQAQRASGNQAEFEPNPGAHRIAGGLLRRHLGASRRPPLSAHRAGRRRGRVADRLRDRRRYAATQIARPRRAGFLHPWIRRAAPALVHHWLEGGPRVGLQHIRAGGQALIMAGIDESRPFIPLKIGVLTVSDTRDMADDKSGAILSERLVSAGHELAARAIVPDTVARIRAQVQGWIADPDVDVIITTGGTGFTGRDVTPEAIEPLFEKRMDAFAMLFMMVSHAKIGTSAIQTRATAGVAGATYIFCVPGSPGACRDAWDDILVHQLDYRYRPCNFVEIMPRLDEHLRREKAQGATV